ncbi:AraC family transcriptional regulator (plasmid) [Nocardia sp. NBC_01377]|uniref:AraC family transcriptional regulator n=1 Tax=Nocardia sp. NBC_01377 TaxID=2903595 RepID=UPI002F917426
MDEGPYVKTEQSTHDDEINPSDRVAFWGTEVGSRQCDVRFDVPDTDDYRTFRGRTYAQWYVDGSRIYQMVEFESDAVLYERLPSQLGDDTDKRAIVPLDGEVILKQDDREAVLGPGQLGMITMARTMGLRHVAGVRALILTIPGEMIPDLTDTTPVALNPRDGAIAAAIAMTRALADTRKTCSGEDFRRVFLSMTDLLASSVDPRQEPETADYATVHRQACAFVANVFRDPTVTAPSIAKHLNWSERRLATALKKMGDSPGRLLRRVRLEEAARLLSGEMNLKTSEVAFRCGFGSTSAFREAWKIRYGMSPTDWRDIGLADGKWPAPVETRS